MWTVNVILPHGVRFTITPHGLLLIGAWLAVGLLLWLYVSLLHDSVSRGERLRADQRRVATQPSEKTEHNASFSRALARP
jgi:hypothetical protein